MNHRAGLLIVALVPPLVLVAETVSVELIRVVLGQCDPKLGCSGGVSFALMVSLLGAIVAALAIFVVASLRHEAWASVSQRRLLLWTIALGTVLALALRSIGRWPVNDFALVAWWAVFVGVLAYGLSLVVARSVVRT